MVKKLYEDLSGQIKKYLPEIKTVQLFNSQYDRSNGEGVNGRSQKPFNYPAVFLEFNEFEFRQLSLGVQEFDFTLNVHYGWKSFLNEDLVQLDSLERLYWVIQRFQQGSFARFSRISENWDTSRTDIGITTIKYRGYGKDFNRYVFNEMPFEPITAVTTTIEYIPFSSDTFTNFGTMFSASTDSNGNNEYVAP